MSKQRAWQRMISGRRLDLLDPSPLDVEIGDIAHGLARVARWNGQTSGDHAFSVAQHCLLVEEIFAASGAMSSRARLACLLHDAPEYVIGDMISPFKAVVGGDYRAVEKRLQHAIHLRFGLPEELPPSWKRAIKRADRIAAWMEARHLAGFSEQEAARYFGQPRTIGLPQEVLVPLPAREAQQAFLARFEELSGQVAAGPG